MVLCACGSSPPQAPAEVLLPADILDLTNWKVTLPLRDGDSDKPIEIFQPALATYQSDYLSVAEDGSAVSFQANVGGVPQPGSEFARTELREMTDDGTKEASWSNSDEVHTMSVRQAIIALPPERPSVVAGQIHDEDEYIVLIRLDGTRLYAKADDRSIGDLDTNYQLGTIFDLRLEASNNTLRIYYNDDLKVEYEKPCRTCYFKAGVYLQSNLDRGDLDQAYGQVDIYQLTVEHSP